MRYLAVFIFATLLLPLAVFARMNSENYLIDTDTLDAGGGRSTSTNFSLNDAFGEIAIGNSTSTNYLEEVFITSYLFRALSLSAPSAVFLAGKSVSVAAQTTTGTMSNVEVTDDGTAGWSLTMTSKHFTATSSVKLLSGSNSTVNFTGRYDGLLGVLDPNGMFIMEITTGGAVGTAVFKWTDLAGNVTVDVTTASQLALSNGISVQFSPATYAAGDKWSVGVDVFPYTGLTVTPGTITAVSGDNGVTAGPPGALTGSSATSDAKTLMTGASNDSAGTYRQDEGLELQIHPNSLQENFSADATLTII